MRFTSSFPKIFLLLFIIPLLTGCESRKSIVNQLDEKEANEILVFLSARGIDAVKVQSQDSGGAGAAKIVLWDISVPTDRSNEAMSLLNQAGLPRRRGSNLLNIFTNTGLVPSELAEKIRYQAGLAEQIASIIRKMDGVLDAEVQVSFPEEDPLNPGKTKGDITASVYVKHSGVLDDPNVHLETKIKRLVTGSVTGLKYDNVTVIGDRARFSGIPSGYTATFDEDKSLVTVWSIIMVKDSVTRFRVYFFSLLLTTLLLLFSLIWMIWKISPILEDKGGLSAIFQLSPLVPKKETEEEKKEEEESEEEGEETEESDEEETEGDEEEEEDREDGVT